MEQPDFFLSRIYCSEGHIPVINYSIDSHRDRILGKDFLRRNIKRNSPQIHLNQMVHTRNDEEQTLNIMIEYYMIMGLWIKA